MLFGFSLSFSVLFSFLVHVKHLQNYKDRRHKELFSLTENAAPELPQMLRL